MFVTFLRSAENRTGAPDFMSAHSDWIAQGFADGVGSLRAAAGGAILAHGESCDAYDAYRGRPLRLAKGRDSRNFRN